VYEDVWVLTANCCRQRTAVTKPSVFVTTPMTCSCDRADLAAHVNAGRLEHERWQSR
jgi:hypothetical protein